MANRYYEQDGNLGLLKGKTVAIIGYGSQGHAHALNLRDSGVSVIVGLYPGSKSWAKAESAGLRVMTTAEAAKAADVMMVLVSDHLQADIYEKDIKPGLTAGKTLMFAHGISIHFKTIVPPADVDVSMIAPKAPGHRVRELYTEGVGVPALVAVHQNASGKALEQGLAYALALGCLKAGVIETSFREETESDLFGEQAVLCGGASELIRAGFETRVPTRIEADRRSNLRRRPRLHALFNIRYRGIWRLYARSAHRERTNTRRDEEDSIGDSIRRIRQSVDRRKQERPPQVLGHARSGGAPEARNRGRGAPQNDAVPEKEERCWSTRGHIE